MELVMPNTITRTVGYHTKRHSVQANLVRLRVNWFTWMWNPPYSTDGCWSVLMFAILLRMSKYFVHRSHAK